MSSSKLQLRKAVAKIKNGPIRRQFEYWVTGVEWAMANKRRRTLNDALAIIATLAFGLRDVLTPRIAGLVLGATYDDAETLGLGTALRRMMAREDDAHCDVGSGGCVTGGDWCVSDSTGCGGPSPGGGFGFGSRWA